METSENERALASRHPYQTFEWVNTGDQYSRPPVASLTYFADRSNFRNNLLPRSTAASRAAFAD